MRQTLFYIPETLFGLPLFGWGWGLGLLVAVVAIVHCYQYLRHGKIGDVGGSLALLGIGGVMLIFVVPNLAEPGRGVAIRGYGTGLLVAILAAFLLLSHLAKRQGIVLEKVYSLALWSVVTGIIGARLFYVTEYWRETFLDQAGQVLPLGDLLFRLLNFAGGGLVVLGSILGGALGAFIFMRRNNMPVLRTFDIMAPAMILGSAIGRIGCLLNGCCFGGVTDVPWGIVFPPGSPVHVHQVAHGDTFLYGLKFDEVTVGERKLLTVTEVQPDSEAETSGLKPNMVLWSIAGKLEGEPIAGQPQTRWQAAELLTDLRKTTPEGKLQFDFLPVPPERELVTCMLVPPHSEVLPVHPTQIYSSVLALLLCGTLLFLGRSRFYQQRAGLVFASFMVLYAVGRFFIEMIRTDEASFFGTGLTVSQNVSIVVGLAGIALFVCVCRIKSSGHQSAGSL
ncbi:MAG: prolipoprotein diacylglyceryl transferase [Planctomycetaceae bacterium]|nr:prolipoprotein diacylglyceryl transferase [Planctomycetaceae bacterium]